MEKAERDEQIEKYGRAYDDFVAALNTIPKDTWEFKPALSEWSVHQVIVHLADSETNSYLRARRMIAEPGQPLMGYDQDVWANTLDYHSKSWEDALEVVRLVRKLTYELIKDLPDEVWAHSAVHPEYEEPYRFEKWLEIYAHHPYDHRQQILNNYEAWKEQNG